MADVTLYPPTSILANHSHQIYHHPTPPQPSNRSVDFGLGLGMSGFHIPMPVTPPSQSEDRLPLGQRTTTFLRSPYCPSHPPSRRHPLPAAPAYTAQPPADGACPLAEVPDEILLSVFAHASLEDLLRLRRVCRRFDPLALHPSLHRSLSLFALPHTPLPKLLTRHILPSVRHLHLHLFPLPIPSPISASSSGPSSPIADQPTNRVMALLDVIEPDQLISLSLPFSAPFLPATELREVLVRIGRKLAILDLRGSAVEGSRCLKWLTTIGEKNRDGGLRELDLGFTSISALPGSNPQARFPMTDTPQPTSSWKALRKLSLASCSSLSASTLSAFLAALPANLESLDLSRLEQTSYTALHDMRVVSEGEGEISQSTKLREIKLVGIDHLTRSNIRSLKEHWQSQRSAILPTPPTAFVWRVAPARSEKRKVWGETGTPEPLPLPPASLPRLIPTPTVLPTKVPSSWMSTSVGTPELCSRSSSATSEDSIASIQDNDSTAFARPSALSSHSALWNALSHDSDQGMDASPDVWHSTLPDHPYLPSRSAPKPLSLPLSNKDWNWQHPQGAPTARRPIGDPTNGEQSVMINVTHSAILESEDEEGYRMFIGEVSGADVLPVGLGLGVGVGPELVMYGGMGGWGGGIGSVGGYAREGEEYLDQLAGI